MTYILTKCAASFNEKLVLSNGLNISPLRQASDTRSLRESVLAIDNEKDLSEYLSGQHVRLPPRTGPPKYERNAVCVLPVQTTRQDRSNVL